MSVPWWRDAVVYQIYPRSFADADADGVGDLRGLRERLGYLQWLGVDALWLSPIYVSPMADFGYDVADYRAIDPVFGTLEDFDALVEEAHARDIRVLLDWVPNHTSDRHPWFQEARSSRDSPRRDWYVWRDGSPDRPPNNWRRAFGAGPAWTWDAATEQFYLHIFLPEQPDLNWANPEVREAMHDALRFWLDRGVDGFRADVVHLIGKDPALPDLAADVDFVSTHDYHGTHELLRGVRRVLDEYPGDRMMVGEVNLRETARIATYYGEGDELHLAFNFLSIDAGFDAALWRDLVAEVGEALAGAGAWPTWVVGNHDTPRARTRFGGDERAARAAAVLLLTLRGTPFVYAGDELGLEDAVVPPERVVDPGGRDGGRAPVPWTRDGDHGWPGGAWLPFPPEPGARSAEALRADQGSILHLYRRILALRREQTALSRGDLDLVGAPPGVLAFDRTHEGERLRVAVNFGDAEVALGDDGGGWTVLLDSGGRADVAFGGVLAPHTAAVLVPAG